MGYTFDAKTKEWIQQAMADNIEESKAYCRRRGFQLIIDLPQYRRNSTYRKAFFESHPGLFGRDFYFCSYCGKLLRKDRVTVDHLLAVRAVQKSRFLQWFLKKLKIKNVNDQKNLVPACARCNERKGTKTGFWLLRGLIGCHSAFWISCYVLLLCAITAFFLFCIPAIQSLK